MAAGLLASKLPSALATARPAATSSAGPSCQPRLHLFEPDVPGRRPRPGSKGGLGLSSALSYALPSTGRCRPFPGQDSGCRNEESRAKGDMSNPPTPHRPGKLAEQWCRLAAPAGASRKDLVVLFRTRVLQLFQVIVLGFFSWHLP